MYFANGLKTFLRVIEKKFRTVKTEKSSISHLKFHLPPSAFSTCRGRLLEQSLYQN